MQRKVQETCGFTNVTNVYGGIQLKCQKNRKHQKSIRFKRYDTGTIHIKKKDLVD